MHYAFIKFMHKYTNKYKIRSLIFSYLTIVRSKVDLASLWKVIITLVAGKSVLQNFRRHLQNKNYNLTLN